MIQNTDIDLTENNDFGKKDPLIVHVKNGIIDHPRIPWKINSKKSYLNKYYGHDGDFEYTTIFHTYINSNAYNVQYNAIFSPQYNTISVTYSNVYNIDADTYYYNDITSSTTSVTSFVDNISHKDKFGLYHKIKYNINKRIPDEMKTRIIYHSIFSNSRIPDIFRNKNNYYMHPGEIFKPNINNIRNKRLQLLMSHNNKRIPWRGRNNSFVRVGERQSERGLVYYI